MNRDPVVKTSIAIPRDLLQWLREHSEKEGRSVSRQVVWLISRYKDEITAD